MTRIVIQLCVLAALAVLISTLYLAHAESIVKLEVEPRIVSVDSVLKVRLVAAPPEYSTIVVRLEGEDKSTGYMTLSIGSIAAIDLHDYGLTPGVYSVVAYDTPGGRVLARVEVLVVNVRIVSRPAVPTVGEMFTLTVFVEPPGYGYTATLHLDGETIATVHPGEPITLKLDERGPYTICVDLEALLGETRLYAVNVTCRELVLNLPPIVTADLRLEGNYLILVIDARDPDGILASVEYNCKMGDLEKRGLVTSGLAHIPLFTVSQAEKILEKGIRVITCNVTAVDNAGSEVMKVYEFNATSLVAAAAPPKTAQGKPPEQTRAAQQTRPPPRETPSPAPGVPAPAQQLLLPVLAAIVAAGAAGAVLVKKRSKARRAEEGKPGELRAITREDIAEIMVRLDKLETQIGETLGRLGELQGEVDEIRKKLRTLEEQVNELQIRVARSHARKSEEKR